MELVWRCIALVATGIMICQLSPQALAEEETRTKWVYEGGWFAKDGDKWIEMNAEALANGKPFEFKFSFANDDFVQIADRGRGVEVRLMEDVALLYTYGQGRMTELYKGHWHQPPATVPQAAINAANEQVSKLGGEQTDNTVHAYLDWGSADSQSSPLLIKSIRFTNATDELLEKLPVIPYEFDLHIANFENHATDLTNEGLAALKKQTQLRQLSVSTSSITGAGLATLADLPKLESVSVVNTAWDATGLGGLSRCKTLKCLTLLRTELEDPAMEEICQLTTLQRVQLYGNKFTDKNIPLLGNLTDLRELEIERMSISGVGLGNLKDAKKLRLLHLGDEITDEGLAEIGQLSSLKRIRTSSGKITDVGVKSLSKLTSLIHLRLQFAQLTDEGMESLAPLTNLVYLDVSNTKITDAGLEHLKGLKRLFFFRTGGTKVTDAGRAKLKESLPDLH